LSKPSRSGAKVEHRGERGYLQYAYITCSDKEGDEPFTEMLVKLARLGIPFVQVPVHHYPRQHGSATGANPGVILRAFRELLRLRVSIRGWHPLQPLEKQAS